MYMIYIVLTVLFLHISVMRIVIRGEVVFDTDGKSAFVLIKLFFIPIFKLSFDYGKIADYAKSGEKAAEESIKKRQSMFKRYIVRAGLAFIKRIEVRYIGLSCLIGTGDAASTALLCGGICSVLDGVCDVLGCEKYSDVTPDYDNTHVKADFGGIISFCPADIIYVAISALGKGKSESNKVTIAARSV